MQPNRQSDGGLATGHPPEKKIGSAKQDLKESAEHATQEAKERATRAYDDVKKGTRQAVRDSANYAKDIAADQKSALVTKLNEYRDAATAASEKLQSEDDNTAADKIRKVATGLDNVAGYLRDTEPSELYSEAERLARKHPEIAFGALFVAGLGIARFMKASADERRKQECSNIGTTPSYGSNSGRYTETSLPQIS